MPVLLHGRLLTTGCCVHLGICTVKDMVPLTIYGSMEQGGGELLGVTRHASVYPNIMNLNHCSVFEFQNLVTNMVFQISKQWLRNGYRLRVRLSEDIGNILHWQVASFLGFD